jgi:hypothetical protein
MCKTKASNEIAKKRKKQKQEICHFTADSEPESYVCDTEE